MTRAGGYVSLLICAGLALVPLRGVEASTLIGAEGGLSVAGLRGNDSAYPDSRFGPAAGLLARVTLNPMWSLQPEILVVSKGASVSGGSIALAGTKATLEVTTLEIPVLLRVSPTTHGGVRPSLVFGPAVDFELSEQVSVTGGLGGTHDSNILKSTDFGVTAGLGLDIPQGSGNWLVDVRSTFGLTNVEEPAVGDNGIYNWNLVLMLGYGWRK